MKESVSQSMAFSAGKEVDRVVSAQMLKKVPVSYTHLDVYKRQIFDCATLIIISRYAFQRVKI